MSVAAFLDRDGTIIVDRNYLADPDGVELLPNAAEGLSRLQSLGMLLVVVSNQSGVGRGYFDAASVEQVNSRLVAVLEEAGVTLDAIYVCPHAPAAGCDCRKPRRGLFDQAAAELGVDLRRSFVVGDRASDTGAAHAIGATAIEIGGDAPDLLAAAELVAQHLQGPSR